MINPFDLIDSRLSNIENILLDLNRNRVLGEVAQAGTEILTVAQSAEFLSLKVATIYSLISRREIPHFKKGKRVYFFKQELIDYLKEGRKKTNTELEAEATIYVANKKAGKRL